MPEVYLKYFATDKFVYVLNTSDKYKKNIQRAGIGSGLFKKKKFYSFPGGGNNLELAFSKIEAYYNEIILTIESGNNLGTQTKTLIVNWLHITKLRSQIARNIYESFFDSFSEADESPAEDMLTKQGSINSTNLGKAFHLMSFLEKDYQKSYDKYLREFLSKEWTVLTSTTKNFLTSDNPGYSYTFRDPNTSIISSPLTREFNLSGSGLAIHCFPLTPKYCLVVKPISLDRELTIGTWKKLLDSEIKIESAKAHEVDDINSGVILTRLNLIIAKSREDIELDPTVKQLHLTE